jgi:dethiobiotin synthetase
MSRFFVTGTGTDIGKTVVSSHLLHQLHRAGRDALGLKPVASGVDPTALEASDPGRLLRAMGRPVDEANLRAICPWRYVHPLAPDAAAARIGESLEFEALVDFVNAHASREDLLVEGVGGVRVPLAKTHSVLDWMTATRLPALVVTGSYLGAISHLLSALDSLKSAKIPVLGVVVNRSVDEPMPVEEMLEAARPWLPNRPVVVFPRLSDPWDFDAAPDLVRPLGG